MAQRLEVNEDYVVRKWLNQAEATPLDYFNEAGEVDIRALKAMPRELQQNLTGIELVPSKYGTHVKIKVVDSQHALDSIAKFLGMFKDKGDEEALGKSLGDAIREAARRAEQRPMIFDAEDEASERDDSAGGSRRH